MTAPTTRADLEAAVIALRSNAVVADVIARRGELRDVLRVLIEVQEALRIALARLEALIGDAEGP